MFDDAAPHSVATVLDRPPAMPVSRTAAGAQSLYPPDDDKPPPLNDIADARRFPSHPEYCLHARLRNLPGLYFGAHPDRRIQKPTRKA